ncbi:ATP-binding protein [Thermus sp.]|uniref:ATP-binding protein n=1 Tax=Thermus sp. TaxID=275 RepID=UPI003919EB40
MENRDRIGVIILNVKHGDLLSIDQPPPRGLEPEQHELWEKLGLTPKPFSNVRYLLPHGKDTPTTGRPNSFRIPERNWFIYAYSLQDTYNKLDLLLSNIPDPWDTVGALIGEISQGLSDPKTGLWGPSGKWKGVQNWQTLLNGEPLVKDGQAQGVGDVRPQSVARFRRLLRRIVETRQTGIFVPHRSSHIKNLSEEIAKIRGGETVVVDIARLADDEQTLVFGDILRTIYNLYAEEGSEREDLPEKVIIFVDELNKYAPARRKDSPILEQVLDIAERGRSLGVVLFGAEQFMSAVHERVAGNSSTLILGRSGSAELSSPVYRFLDPAIKANISRLQKGELILSHATFRQPVKISFPKPAYLQEGAT